MRPTATGSWSSRELCLYWTCNDWWCLINCLSCLSTRFQVNARNIDGSTPLCDACAAGNLECVKLLLEYGATVNPPLFTFSPLHEACMGGKKACFVSKRME